MLLCSCIYGTQSYADCMSNPGPALGAWADVIAAAEPRPASIRTRFKLCGKRSTIAAYETAVAALRAEGYQAEKSRYEEVHHCWNVETALPAESGSLRPALERMCRVAEAANGVFMGWSADVAGRHLYGHGDYISINGVRLRAGRQGRR